MKILKLSKEGFLCNECDHFVESGTLGKGRWLFQCPNCHGSHIEYLKEYLPPDKSQDKNKNELMDLENQSEKVGFWKKLFRKKPQKMQSISQNKVKKDKLAEPAPAYPLSETPKVPVNRIDAIIVVLHDYVAENMSDKEGSAMAGTIYRSVNNKIIDALVKYLPNKAIEYSLRSITDCSLDNFPVLAVRSIKSDYGNRSMFVQSRRRDISAKQSDTLLFTILEEYPNGKREIFMADDWKPLEPDIE